MGRLFLLCLSTIISSPLYAQTILDTLRHLNVKPGGGYSAIWGYAAPNNREYALLGCNGSGGQLPGTSIVDITDISNVRQVVFVSGPASPWREMKTYRQYAYIVTEASGSGTQIVDLSYLPDSVHLVRTFVYTQGTKNTAKSHTISIHDGFMYLNGCANWGTQYQRGTVMFDLRQDPTNPVFLGEYSPTYFHDSYVLRDTIYGSAVYSDTATAGLWIADVRNKSNAQTIGRIRYTGSGTHNAWVTKDRMYVITTDEIGTTPKTLKFWNIGSLPSIPASPTTTYTPSPTDIEHNITIRGDYAYVAWYTLGVVIVNITNPASPTYAGGYDTSTQPPGSYNGVWGVYPYFPSGKVIAGDMQNGLWVFSFSDLAPRVPVTLLNPAMNETTAVSSPITFRWTKSANLSKDPHWYDVRLTGPALDTTWRANDSVTVFSALGNLQSGGQYTWYVTTRDEFNSTRSPQTFQFQYGVVNTVSSTVEAGWNILSVPVTVADRRKTVVFPTSTSNAFAYIGSAYVSRDTLEYGDGYWLKFPSTQLVSVAGEMRSLDTIHVVEGWNIIGSISTSIPVDSIIQIPEGIVVSPYFSYSSTGYSSATLIDPMRGYWVKANQPGSLVVSSTGAKSLQPPPPMRRSSVKESLGNPLK